MSPTKNIPICVDLDGTLVTSDTLIDSIKAIPIKNAYKLFRFFVIGLNSKAQAKAFLSTIALPRFDTLEFNNELLIFLKTQYRTGRKLVLVTGAHESIARMISDRLPIFTETFASNASTNLTGHRKAQFLIERYGAQGFDYAGNCRTDLPVWRAARSAIVVNASSNVRALANRHGNVIIHF